MWFGAHLHHAIITVLLLVAARLLKYFCLQKTEAEKHIYKRLPYSKNSKHVNY